MTNGGVNTAVSALSDREVERDGLGLRTRRYSLRNDTLRRPTYNGCRRKERETLRFPQLDVFYTMWGWTHHEVETDRGLGWCSREMKNKRRERRVSCRSMSYALTITGGYENGIPTTSGGRDQRRRPEPGIDFKEEPES